MYKCKHCDEMLTAPVMTQFFLATNLEALTGRSHTSKVLTRVCLKKKEQQQQPRIHLEYSFYFNMIIVSLAHGSFPIPVFHGSTHRHCRCTDWPASMARWGEDPRSSLGPTWLSASA